jgi:CO/xanthine dehydrogenase Mo-binding subunit
MARTAPPALAVDAGRILNEKLARSQITGATVMGIGMTMLEETIFDSATGRIANATFGDYLIPVNADCPTSTSSSSANRTSSARSAARASVRSGRVAGGSLTLRRSQNPA